MDLTASLLGCIPGVWLGAPGAGAAGAGVSRRHSSCSNVSNKDTGWILLLVVVIAPVVMLVHQRHGFPAFGAEDHPRTAVSADGGVDPTSDVDRKPE